MVFKKPTYEQNPWWKGREFIVEDPDFKKWGESKLKWVPDLLEKLKLEPFSLTFILGPRQVGKTTLIKLAIDRLLKTALNPKAVFYYRCDRLSDYKELDQVLGEYLSLKRSEGIETSYIFLDEITFPKEWYRAIKYRIDTGQLAKDVLVLTGSWSIYIRRETETFPGRRGHGQDIIFHPLSFREFLKIANPRLYENIGELNSLRPARIWESCLKLAPWLDELNEAFPKYMECGGTPLAVKSLLGDALLSSFLSDLSKLGRSEGLAKRVLKAVIEKLPSPMSLNSVAKEFEIGSHKTVFHYLDLFDKMFIAKSFYFIDPSKLIEIYRKERKIHLTDPLLYTVFSEWCMTKVPDQAALAESIVATHLARRFTVGYWRDGTEIDVVLPEVGLGFEIKWGERVEVRGKKIGKIRETLTLTRNEFREDPLAVPISTFLACLKT